MKICEFDKLSWKCQGEEPVLRPPFFSSILADPTFLMPDETYDSKWHLFAHSIWGIHHYVSSNGVDWKHLRICLWHSMRPFVYRSNDCYYLFYERYRPFQLLFAWMPKIAWYSQIEVRTSKDLEKWSHPHIVLRPTLRWHRNSQLGAAVGNPCLVQDKGRYCLFYSAGLTWIPDCGFAEPSYIGVAYGDKIDGLFEPLSDPILSARSESKWCDLASGSIKVKRIDDGFIALQNGIYWDKALDHSGSAILPLASYDGVDWHYQREEPILKPTTGWRRSHIYAFDFKNDLSERNWYLYYNARNDWHWTKGKECIGLMKAVSQPSNQLEAQT